MKPPFGPVAAALALGLGIPTALAVAVTYLRPDLVAAMMGHVFGPTLVLAVMLLCLCATGLYLVAALAKFKSRTPRVLISIATALIFTLPALVGILFGPIVFAFMYGRVE